MTAHRARDAAPILSFDIGGTNVRAAQYDRATGRLGSRAQRPSIGIGRTTGLSMDRLWQALACQLADLASEVLAGARPASVAVAFPAPLDPDGHALASPTLFGERGLRFPVRRALQDLWPASRVVVLNDLSAAGYRYVDRWQDFAVVTVGSGIGHKIFLDGRPQLGPHGRGGECGHLVVCDDADAPLCECGGRGHLGGLASGRGTVRLAQWRAVGDPKAFRAAPIGAACQGRPDALDSFALVRGFRDGDPWVARIVTEAAGLLGRALAGMHLAVGIETFVLVGGFALGLGDGYRRLVAAGARRSCWDLGQEWDEMVHLGEPDDDHGLIGAARHAAALLDPFPALAPVALPA